VADHLEPERKQLPGYKNQLKLACRCFSDRNLTVIDHFLYKEMHLFYFNCSKLIFKKPKFIVYIKYDLNTFKCWWMWHHKSLRAQTVIHNKFTKNVLHL